MKQKRKSSQYFSILKAHYFVFGEYIQLILYRCFSIQVENFNSMKNLA